MQLWSGIASLWFLLYFIYDQLVLDQVILSVWPEKDVQKFGVLSLFVLHKIQNIVKHQCGVSSHQIWQCRI